MDNNAKVVSNEETRIPAAEQQCEAATVNVSDNKDAEAVDNNVCVETESPALAISEATDDIEGEEAEGEAVHYYHKMSKEQLVERLKEILNENKMNANREVAAIKGAFFVIRNEEREKEMLDFLQAGNDPSTFNSEPDQLENELKELLNQFKERRGEYLQAQEEIKNANLAEKIRIIEEMTEIVSDIDNIGSKFSQFQELQQRFKNVGEVPAGADNETWKSYQQVVEQFYDHLKMHKELRDLDFKKNLQAKESLIQQAEALGEESDVVVAARKLQGLHDAWREIGPVARELREQIWDRFKAASTIVNKRHQDYFLARKEQEKENEEAKRNLCEEAEAIDVEQITGYAGWDEAVKKIIDIQTRWKAVGFASRKANNELFARFRATCDKIFEAKNAYYKKLKEEYAENLAKKTALCEKAEEILAKEDFGRFTPQMLELQSEWRKIGSVGKKYSDAIWKRFSTACDAFFAERKKENASRTKEEAANLAAKKEIIEKLKEIPLDGQRKETISVVRELQKQWQEIGHVPFKVKDTIFKEYRKICDAIYESYDKNERGRRMKGFESRVKNLRGEGKADRERQILLRSLEARRNELSTYENNMGFFNVKTSAGNSMVKELERKIKKLREEMDLIQEKLAMLDRKDSEPAAQVCSEPESPAMDIAQAADAETKE